MKKLYRKFLCLIGLHRYYPIGEYADIEISYKQTKCEYCGKEVDLEIEVI